MAEHPDLGRGALEVVDETGTRWRKGRFFLLDEESPVAVIPARVSYVLIYGTDFWQRVRVATGLTAAFDVYEEDTVPFDQLPALIAAAESASDTIPDDGVTATYGFQRFREETTERQLHATAHELGDAIRAIV